THFRARAKVGLGIISARFAVDLELAEADAPDRAVIKASGQAPGSAVEATGEMRLSGPEAGPAAEDRDPGVAILGPEGGGGGTADRLINQAFDCMRSKLEA